MPEPIAIIGAGLSGLMCALHLAKRGFKVSIFERRSYQELCAKGHKFSGVPGRSMSMDISARGSHALLNVGIFEKIRSHSIPMKYRIIHDIFGNQKVLPYGQSEDEHILTVSRTYLFQTLLDACANYDNITVNFGHRLVSIDFRKKSLEIANETAASMLKISPKLVIGADGISSVVRALAEAHDDATFNMSYFPLGYKELNIPQYYARAFDINAMHMWPRNELMLVAQPNMDRSFTCALLMCEHGKEISFSAINSTSKVRELFSALFKDASDLMPFLESEYIINPVGKLKIVQGSKWAFADFVLLIGDAAHGMVPFFGQGVNCCFEDCTFLSEHLDNTNNDWQSVFYNFNELRVKDANAINVMSYENYPELFANTNIAKQQLIKEIEAMLSKSFPEKYRTYHNLVCFDRVPYTLAQKVKRLQVPMLERLSEDVERIDQIDLKTLERELAIYKQSLTSLTKGNPHEHQ